MTERSVETGKARGKCPLCNGKGVVVKQRGDARIERRCVQCRGSGRSDGGLQRKQS
jgi:DnaJ-class molecular chaperone